MTKGKACTKVDTCRTPTVTLKANKGWTYRASNAGTGPFAQAGARLLVPHRHGRARVPEGVIRTADDA
jgi:hypothetical protein